MIFDKIVVVGVIDGVEVVWMKVLVVIDGVGFVCEFVIELVNIIYFEIFVE